MRRNRQPVTAAAFERRQFHSLSDVRREMVLLYWQCKQGKIDKGIAPSLVKLLDLIAHYMVETEAERQANRLAEQIEAARQELLAKGIEVPRIIDVIPEVIN